MFFFFIYIAFFRVDNFLQDVPFREKKIEDIYEGIFYDPQGKIIITNLQAKTIRVNAPQERVNASGGIQAQLKRKDRQVKLFGDQLQYFAGDQKTYLYGKTALVDQDLQINADNIQIDHQTNLALFNGNLRLKKAGTIITGETMEINLDNEAGTVKTNVLLRRKAEALSKDEFKKKETTVSCRELSFKKISGNAEIFCQADLKIWQEDKQGIADSGTFYEAQENLILNKNVTLVFERSNWLLDDKTVNKLKQSDLKTALYEKLIIISDQTEISTRTKDFSAQGHIKVTMKEKYATSDKAIYKEKDKKIYMTGNVRLKKADGSWVKAEKVIVDIDKESFLAEGNVETTIILKR